jgi:nitroreductase
VRDIFEIVRDRHSSRVSFDRERCVSEQVLLQILEAVRWAPTAHNMQNFEIILIDDKATLAAVGSIRTVLSETFIRENYAQLSFSEDELLLKKTGLLASMFPASWRIPNAKQEDVTDLQHSFLGSSLQDCPTLLIVIYDTRKRAPASAEDMLGIMSLGCVMENMWLAAETLGIGMQVLSVFGGREVEDHLHRILGIPDYMKIAFACRLGYPAADGKYLRVRRHVREFTRHNRYGNYGLR